MVAEAGGVIGVTLSTLLLGGDDLDRRRQAFDLALELAGPDTWRIGPDMDGGLADGGRRGRGAGGHRRTPAARPRPGDGGGGDGRQRPPELREVLGP